MRAVLLMPFLDGFQFLQETETILFLNCYFHAFLCMACSYSIYRIWEEMLAFHKYGEVGKEKRTKLMNH
jgi:hypothetical protein